MNVSYFLLSEGSSPFITTNDNPIHKAAHRNTDQLSISFSDIGVLPTNYDNKRLHRVLPHRSGNRLLHNFQHSPIPFCNLMAEDGFDITKEIVDRLNANYKKGDSQK